MTAPWTPERLAEVRARCEAATPGPWTVEGDDRRRPDGGRVYFPSVRLMPGDPTFPAFGRIVINGGPTMEACVAAAGLIASARTALPEALDEIERQSARIAELEGLLSHTACTIDIWNSVDADGDTMEQVLVDTSGMLKTALGGDPTKDARDQPERAK